jgi:type IV secretory pathway VirB9-like protein
LGSQRLHKEVPATMTVAEVISNLLELDQKAEVWFVKSNEDQMIYLLSFLPNNVTKVCLMMPTAIDKREYKENQ